jgi:metal-responsive CopG/Arc/MetJ family transcriptional regulator
MSIAENKDRLNITLDKELVARMMKICQREERSLSSLISLALKAYLPTKEKED